MTTLICPGRVEEGSNRCSFPLRMRVYSLWTKVIALGKWILYGFPFRGRREQLSLKSVELISFPKSGIVGG